MLKRLSVLFLVASASAFAQQVPSREPDVKSIPARLEDYYTFDKDTKDWIWTPDYEKKISFRKLLPPPVRNENGQP